MNPRPLAPQASIIAKLDDGPSQGGKIVKLLNRLIHKESLKICSICHKISGTDDDHTDCKEKLRIEMEAEDFKKSIPEKLDMTKNANDLQPDLKALLEHISKEKKKDS